MTLACGAARDHQIALRFNSMRCVASFVRADCMPRRRRDAPRAKAMRARCKLAASPLYALLAHDERRLRCNYRLIGHQWLHGDAGVALKWSHLVSGVCVSSMLRLVIAGRRLDEHARRRPCRPPSLLRFDASDDVPTI